MALWYCLTARPNSALPKFVAAIGILRTLTCGGWTYVTSTDDHNWHDIFMVSYLVATIPWTLGCLSLSPRRNPTAVKYRKIVAGAFFGTLVPSLYFFLQHKVQKVPGGEAVFVTSLEHSLTIFQLTPFTPSSNGRSFCWTLRSMLSLHLTLKALRLPSGM